ncbi:ABC transporter permease [Haladaptatus sp. CMAA 1911]|uniref:ABC transporter permease n=1 Tax=unclassified Haladaptatus TaxID=2622732 RepID=UPI0037553BD2
MEFNRTVESESDPNADSDAERAEIAASLSLRSRFRLPFALAGSVLLVLVTWQVAVTVVDVPTVLLPAPSEIWVSAVANVGSMYPHFVYTGTEVLAGWTVGVGSGILLAAMMASSARLRAVLYPTLLAVRIVPLVVFAPLLILAFGATFATRVGIAALLTFFPVTVAALDGLRSVPKMHLDLGRLVGASRWRSLVSVRLPHALPELFTGIKIATPLAVEGVLIAEFLAATRGVGFELLETSRLLRTPLLFAYLAVLVLGALVLFGAVVAGERSVTSTEETGSLGESFVTGRPVGELGREALPGAFVALLGILVAWQVGAAVIPNASVFLPPPADVGTTLLSSPGLFVAAGYATGKKLLVGWLLGAGVGIALGVCIRLVPGLRTVLYPYLVGLRVMPQIALAPLLLVWFGVSFEAAAVMIALSTFFPLTVGTVDGLAATPNEHVELLRSVDAPRWCEVLFVRFRHAVPSLFAGVKLSVVTALVGTVIAEWFVAERGLGVLVLQGMSDFAPELTFAAATCLFALGGIVFGIAALLQRYVSW